MLLKFSDRTELVRIMFVIIMKKILLNKPYEIC